jgi:hypothetical protein
MVATTDDAAGCAALAPAGALTAAGARAGRRRAGPGCRRGERGIGLAFGVAQLFQLGDERSALLVAVECRDDVVERAGQFGIADGARRCGIRRGSRGRRRDQFLERRQRERRARRARDGRKQRARCGGGERGKHAVSGAHAAHAKGAGEPRTDDDKKDREARQCAHA